MNINITGNNIPTSFDVVCSACDWTGVATLDLPEKISNLSLGGEIKFTANEEDTKCPKCKVGYIYGVSGKYKRNKNSNHMERVGDHEE